MLTPWRLFLCQMALNIFSHIAKASLCLGGQDIYATIQENSPTGEFVANLSITGDPGTSSIRLCLTGENAAWFYLEGRTIRLNSSISRTLDREALGSVLIAALTCYEDETIRSEYRIMVEILNENDNMPHFLEDTIQPRYLSELIGVNTMVFTVKARDGDGDIITYMTDKSSSDSSYFRIDLPNSGMVILDKPLDYEVKTQLKVVIHAVEMNTEEGYSTSATVTVNVLDGDDQYPRFLPCTPVYEDRDHSICTNPVYTANITETDEDTALNFLPGPVLAEDGDKDILAPVVYSILSGDDNQRFTIDSETGEMFLRQRVEDRLLTPLFSLRVMAAQEDDPKKYTVASALVRVVSENRHPPFFNKTVYKGFLRENSSPATLVTTYRNQVLVVQAIDKDFRHGLNPKIHYTIRPMTGSSTLYHITHDGIVIAKTERLKAFDRQVLEVIATDDESGETARTSVDIEVLQKGLPVPRSPFEEQRLFGDLNTGMAGGIAALILIVSITGLFLFLWAMKRRRDIRDPADRASVALGKHPNVTLRWFQQVGLGRSVSLIEDASYNNQAFVDHECSSGLNGREHLYTIRDETVHPSMEEYGYGEFDRPGSLQDMLPILVIPNSSSVRTNGKALTMLRNEEDSERLEETEASDREFLSACIKTQSLADMLLPVLQQDLLTTQCVNKDFPKDACSPKGPRQESSHEVDEKEEDDGNPYKAMVTMIYSSNEEDTADDEPVSHTQELRTDRGNTDLDESQA